MLKKLFHRKLNHQSSPTDQLLPDPEPFGLDTTDFTGVRRKPRIKLPIDTSITADIPLGLQSDHWTVPSKAKTPETPNLQSQWAERRAVNAPFITQTPSWRVYLDPEPAPHGRFQSLPDRSGGSNGQNSGERGYGPSHSASAASDAVSRPTISVSKAPRIYFLCQLCHGEMDFARSAMQLEGTEGYVVGVCRSCVHHRQMASEQNPPNNNEGLPMKVTQREQPRQRQATNPFRPAALSHKALFTTSHVSTATAAANGMGAAQGDPTSSKWRRGSSPPVKRVHTCLICTEEYPHNDFLLPTSSCAHEADYCRVCMQQQIKSDLNSKGWDKIRCPDTSCQQNLSDADVLRHAPGKLYDRYSDLSIKSVLAALPDFHRCLNPQCTSGQIHTEADGPLFICHECGHKTCMKHSIPWHDGDTCQEYDYRTKGGLKRKEERASEATKRKTTRPCPKCKAPIEKNNGCDHMKCLNCTYEFCWECKADYASIREHGNAFHATSCKYYASPT